MAFLSAQQAVAQRTAKMRPTPRVRDEFPAAKGPWPYAVRDALADSWLLEKNLRRDHDQARAMKAGKPFRPSGMLEFEPVSVAQARAVANRLPGGIEALLDRTPNGWEKVREPLDPEDLRLKPGTIDWLRALPKHALPIETATAFPRLVNCIADVWTDPDELEAVWESVFNDGRRQRRGFPVKVRSELETLRALAGGSTPPKTP